MSRILFILAALCFLLAYFGAHVGSRPIVDLGLAFTALGFAVEGYSFPAKRSG